MNDDQTFLKAVYPVVRDVQHICNSAEVAHEIHFPQIVVVGSQSSGKSSVLESLVGHEMFPRGTGIVTRCPIELHMVSVDSDGEEYVRFMSGTTWSDKIDVKNVEREIRARTNAVAGESKGVVNEPIVMYLYSSRVVSDLSLIDLPGLVKVRVDESQPKDIPEVIRNMVLEYIKNDEALILAVTAANQDIATSDSLQLAKEVDPEGKRTLGVLTKLDLVERPNDILPLLNNERAVLQLGYVGVINRCQADIDNKISIQDVAQREMKYIQKNYAKVAEMNGSKNLTKKLSRLLMNHIKDALPKLHQAVAQARQHWENEVAKYGVVVEPFEQTSLLTRMINQLQNFIADEVTGYSPRSYLANTDDQLNTGANISILWTATLRARLDEMQCESAKDKIASIVQNAKGLCAYQFAPDNAFASLVRSEIELLRPIILGILDETGAIIMQCLSDAVDKSSFTQQYTRYPLLLSVLGEVVKHHLQKRMEITTDRLTEMIDEKKSHPNIYRREFVENFAEKKYYGAGEETTYDSENITFDTFTGVLKSLFDNGPNNDQTESQLLEDTNRDNESIVGKAINVYFSIVKDDVYKFLPEKIKYHLVDMFLINFTDCALKEVMEHSDFEGLFAEPEENKEERRTAQMKLQALMDVDEKLNAVKKCSHGIVDGDGGTEGNDDEETIIDEVETTAPATTTVRTSASAASLRTTTQKTSTTMRK